MAPIAENIIVRKSVRVALPIERAFSLFIEQMEAWWPATHHIAPTPFQTIIVEPRIGGRWYERDAQGNDCSWGFVRAWNPPELVTLSWHLQEDWSFDPSAERASDMDIRFTPESASTTLIELTHYNLERHGDKFLELRDKLEGPGAWITILESYAKKAGEEGQA